MSELEKRLRNEWDQDKRNAVRKTELSCTKKLSEYHQKMTEMENEVAQLKKEFLQQEKSKSPVVSRKSGQILMKSPELTDVEEEPEFSSYLLKEIKEILSNPNQDLLKHYQGIVKEANEWMKENDLSFAFKLLLKKNDEEMTVTSIQIANIKEAKEAIWTVARLQTWFEAAKMDQIVTNDPFGLFDITWRSSHEESTAVKQPEPTTPSKLFSRLNDLRNSLTKSPLQHIKSVFSPTEPPKSRRQLIEDKENRDESNEITFTTSAKKILLDVASSNIKLKRLCRKTTTNPNKPTDSNPDDENATVVMMKAQMLQNTEKIESVVHQMNLVLTENTVRDKYAKSPTKAVKFLIE